MALVNCSECQREVSTNAPSCPHCGNPINAAASPAAPAPATTPVAEPAKRSQVPALLALMVLVGGVVFAGQFRIYTGKPIGFSVVAKESFSFEDTYVNLDDLLGKPRIAVANEHPAVKRQLEGMKIIKTDAEIMAEVEAEYRRKLDEEMARYRTLIGQ